MSEASKTINLAISATANTMDWTAFPSLVAADGLVTYTPGTISPKPDTARGAGDARDAGGRDVPGPDRGDLSPEPVGGLGDLLRQAVSGRAGADHAQGGDIPPDMARRLPRLAAAGLSARTIAVEVGLRDLTSCVK